MQSVTNDFLQTRHTYKTYLQLKTAKATVSSIVNENKDIQTNKPALINKKGNFILLTFQWSMKVIVHKVLKIYKH